MALLRRNIYRMFDKYNGKYYNALVSLYKEAALDILILKIYIRTVIIDAP